jgi:hypothetical protein
MGTDLDTLASHYLVDRPIYNSRVGFSALHQCGEISQFRAKALKTGLSSVSFHHRGARVTTLLTRCSEPA